MKDIYGDEDYGDESGESELEVEPEQPKLRTKKEMRFEQIQEASRVKSLVDNLSDDDYAIENTVKSRKPAKVSKEEPKLETPI